MRRLAVPTLLLLVAGARVTGAYSAPATWSDIRELRAQVELLDESLRSVDPRAPESREFGRREDEIRQRLTSLRDELRRDRAGEGEGVGASKDEVEALRRDIFDLRRDVDSFRGYDERGSRVSIPDGIEIPIVLEEGLSSRTARPEDRVMASVAESVRVGGHVAIPAGTEVRGIVRSVEPARRPAHGGRLELAFDSLVVNGQPVDMRSSVIRISESKVDKSKAGLGALLGGLVGVVAGGKKGLLIGGAVGAAGAIVATKGDEVELPPGTEVVVRLERPVDLARIERE
jgi:hypothetical protein